MMSIFCNRKPGEPKPKSTSTMKNLNFVFASTHLTRRPRDRASKQPIQIRMAQRQNSRASWLNSIPLNYQRHMVADRLAHFACVLPVRLLSRAAILIRNGSQFPWHAACFYFFARTYACCPYTGPARPVASPRPIFFFAFWQKDFHNYVLPDLN